MPQVTDFIAPPRPRAAARPPVLPAEGAPRRTQGRIHAPNASCEDFPALNDVIAGAPEEKLLGASGRRERSCGVSVGDSRECRTREGRVSTARRLVRPAAETTTRRERTWPTPALSQILG